MKDEEIVDLYWARSEAAISETSDKYGGYCRSIAYNILRSDEDSEECVNSCWFSAWNSMPDLRPASLRAFLGKTVRNLALKRWEEKSAQKRGSGQTDAALDELSECVPAPNSGSRFADDLALTEALNGFLASLPAEKRKIFMRRYWYMSTVAEIAEDLSESESKVKMTLLRTRKELKEALEREGIEL